MLQKLTASKKSKNGHKVREDFVFNVLFILEGTERNPAAFENIRVEWWNKIKVILPEFEKQCLNSPLEDVL